MANENQTEKRSGEKNKRTYIWLCICTRYTKPLHTPTEVLRGFVSSGSAKLKRKKMAFGIIRARNLSAGDISSTDKHNARKYETKEEFPENINPNGKRSEVYLKPGSDFLYKEETNLEEVVRARIADQGVKGIKSNSNLAIEYVATINDKKAWENYSPQGFFANTSQWLEQRHGEGSVVAVYEHYDESNPHAHFVVVPVAEKKIKWKNSKGSGERTEKHLNTRDFTGGREKLRALQDDYFRYLTKYGSNFGVPIYRGTLVEHQKREYIQQTVAEIGRLRAKLSDITSEVEKARVNHEILKKQEQNALNEAELKNIENGKFKGGRNWENKGTRDNPSGDLFHDKSEKKRQGMKR